MAADQQDGTSDGLPEREADAARGAATEAAAKVQVDAGADAQAALPGDSLFAGPLEFRAPLLGHPLPPDRTRLPPTVLLDAAVLHAVRAIEHDRGTQVRIAAMAAGAGLSEEHLQRRFSALMGETIGDYARRLQLEFGAVLLKHSEMPVLQTAVAVGYGSAEAFTHAFRRKFGRSPTAFRRWSRRAMLPPGPLEHTLAARVVVDWREKGELLAVRFHGSYAQVGDYWKVFAQLLGEAGLQLEGRRLYGIATDDPEITPNGLIRYECAIESPHPLPAALARAPFSLVPVPRSRVARLRHKGPYAEVFPTYRAISCVWLQENQRQFGDGPALEVYGARPWRAGVGEPDSFDVELAIV